MYDEYVQDQASRSMKAKGLSQGRMIHPVSDTVYPNARLSTTESGDFWYGDLDMADFATLHAVAKEITQSICLTCGDQTMVISA